jgi:hypothetical protein
MPAPRNRRILIIGVLAALFALGGGCLAYLATSSGGSAASSNAANAGEPSSPGSPDESSPGDAGAPGAGSSGGGDEDATPPKPRQSIDLNGLDLGGQGGENCAVIKLTTEVPVRVASVAVRGPGVAYDPGGCSSGDDVPSCDGAQLSVASDSCVVGVRFTGNASSSRVTVELSMRATCTSTDLSPCNHAKVARLSPSPANPIEITWTGILRDVRVTNSHDGGSTPGDGQPPPEGESPPDGESAPEGESPPDGEPAPDDQNVPESVPDGPTP